MPVKVERFKQKDAPPPLELQAQPVGGTARVRVLKDLSWNGRRFRMGEVVNDLPADVARSWIGFGLAEQDKMVEVAPEVMVGRGHRAGPNVTIEVLQGTAKK